MTNSMHIMYKLPVTTETCHMTLTFVGYHFFTHNISCEFWCLDFVIVSSTMWQAYIQMEKYIRGWQKISSGGVVNLSIMFFFYSALLLPNFFVDISFFSNISISSTRTHLRLNRKKYGNTYINCFSCVQLEKAVFRKTHPK